MVHMSEELRPADQELPTKGLPTLHGENSTTKNRRQLPRLPKSTFGGLPPIPSGEPVIFTKGASAAAASDRTVVKKKAEIPEKKSSFLPNPIEFAIESLIFTLESYEQDDIKVLLAMTRDPLEECLIKKIYKLSRRRQKPSNNHGKKSNRNSP
jgi:hypothetical protein